MSDEQRLSTVCVRAGRGAKSDAEVASSPIAPPLIQSATYSFEIADSSAAVVIVSTNTRPPKNCLPSFETVAGRTVEGRGGSGAHATRCPIVEHGTGPRSSTWVIGEALVLHVDERVLGEDGLPDTAKVQPAARMGRQEWAWVNATNMFTLVRPTTAPGGRRTQGS